MFDVVKPTSQKSMCAIRTRGFASKEDVHANPSITLSEQDGIRYLHFGTEWVQGAMCVSRPYDLVLEYQQQMMAVGCLSPKPSHITVLGLGAAALAKFCWKLCAPSCVSTVEVSADVIEIARQWFCLPLEEKRFELVLEDAQTYLRQQQNRKRSDWLLVDLYDSEARGPVYDSVSFYKDCYHSLQEGGSASFNLFGRGFSASHQAISEAFKGQVLSLPETEAGNRVVLAYKGHSYERACQQMGRHAADLQRRWKLPFKDWVLNTVTG